MCWNLIVYLLGYAEGTGNCVSSPPETPRPSHAVARDLTVILYPIGRDKRFNLYVSWESSYDRESGTNCFKTVLMCLCVLQLIPVDFMCGPTSVLAINVRSTTQDVHFMSFPTSTVEYLNAF